MHKHGLQPLAQEFCEKEDLVENVKVWWHPTAHGAKHVDFFLHDWASKERSGYIEPAEKESHYCMSKLDNCTLVWPLLGNG